MKLTVLEKLENGKYLVNYNLDGENLGDKEIDYSELCADIYTAKTSKNLSITFVEPVHVLHIDIDYAEEEGQTHLVNVGEFIYRDNHSNPDYKEVECYEYKTKKGAVNKAKKLVKELNIHQYEFNF